MIKNIYTGSRLQRVRLLRPPGYNEQLFFSEKKSLININVKMLSYNGYRL